MDAFEKLLKLNLKEVQEREVIHVVVVCCLKVRPCEGGMRGELRNGKVKGGRGEWERKVRQIILQARVQCAWNKVNKVAWDCGAIDDLYVCACIHICVYGYVCCVGEGG